MKQHRTNNALNREVLAWITGITSAQQGWRKDFVMGTRTSGAVSNATDLVRFKNGFLFNKFFFSILFNLFF